MQLFQLLKLLCTSLLYELYDDLKEREVQTDRQTEHSHSVANYNA